MTGVFAGALITRVLGQWSDNGNLGLGFAMMSVVIIISLALQIFVLKPTTDNLE